MDHPRIYLDNNATTPIDPDVAKKMHEVQLSVFGNPSSIHQWGQEASQKINESKRLIAKHLGCRANEIIFTSGGTEALNLLLHGLTQNSSGHIITSQIEHSAVIKVLDHIAAQKDQNWEITSLPVGPEGAVRTEDLASAIRPDTRLITLMAVNNETGIKLNLDEAAAIAESKGIPFVVDAIALLGRENFTIPKGVTAMAFAGHKIHGPKGAGFFFLRRGTKLAPLLVGGGQEGGKRPGTENVAGIVGLAEAVKLAYDAFPESIEKMAHLRDRFEKKLIESLGNQNIKIDVNGSGPRICNVSNLSFEGVNGESLLINLDLAGVGASHGSACSSGALEPSKVLLAMGCTQQRAAQSLRFSLSRFTTEKEIDRAVEIMISLLGPAL